MHLTSQLTKCRLRSLGRERGRASQDAGWGSTARIRLDLTQPNPAGVSWSSDPLSPYLLCRVPRCSSNGGRRNGVLPSC